MALIDQTFFVDEIFIPFSVRDDSQEQQVIRFINDYENEFLQKCLGDDFYILFRDGLLATPISQRWVDLRDGVKDWIDLQGKKHEWQTIRNADANFIYYHFMRNQITNTTIVGETSVNTENSQRTGAGNKMSAAWHNMIQQLHQMWFMLLNRVTSATDSSLVYPEFNRHEVCYREFKPINIFGI